MDNKQHVQLPNSMAEDGLTPKDMLIYLAIKRFDGDNGAFPSLQRLKEDTGASIPTIRKIIQNLINKGYMTACQKGRGVVYKFSTSKYFEPFSYEFLDKKDISFTAKSYLAASQQFMFKDVENYGKLSYDNYTLSSMINMPESTIRKCNNELQRLSYMELIKNNSKDIISGCCTDTKLYKMSDVGQAIIWTLKDHEDRIQENTSDISELKQAREADKKLIEVLLKKIESIEKAQSIMEFKMK